jgi:ATP-dependent exoDNAse (exonuclease V) beta subunit
VLEQLDLDADPDAELEAQSTRLPAIVEALLPGAQTSLALREARQILKEFAAGPLWRRLWSLRDCIIARELPVWLPPSMVESGGGGDPVGFASGVIDLAYRHPEEGTLVVADYKTDRVDSEQELQSRAEEYRDQGRLYAHAIRGALQLEALPRFELWFLRAGRTVWVPVDG